MCSDEGGNGPFGRSEPFCLPYAACGIAFCAGCLVGIFNGLAEKEILELGGIAAVGAMSALGAVEGMRPIAELKKLVSTLATSH